MHLIASCTRSIGSASCTVRTRSPSIKGNPTAHNLGLITFGQLLLRNLGTKNLYSASSVDQLPHMVAAHHMLGDGLLMPIPDLDRTDFFLCIGANPLVSNGSIMTAPNMRKRLHDLRARGGGVVVVDRRRSETASAADRHLFIRPGTDALFLLSMIQVIFAEHLDRPGRVGSFTAGVDGLRNAALEFAPETTAPATGVTARELRELARAFAAAQGVAYGRMEMYSQKSRAAKSWLLALDLCVRAARERQRVVIFTTPAVDLEMLAKRSAWPSDSTTGAVVCMGSRNMPSSTPSPRWREIELPEPPLAWNVWRAIPLFDAQWQPPR